MIATTTIAGAHHGADGGVPSTPGTAPPGTAPPATLQDGGANGSPDTAPVCSTDPSANALDGARGWRCVLRIPVRAVHPLAELCVYERVPN